MNWFNKELVTNWALLIACIASYMMTMAMTGTFLFVVPMSVFGVLFAVLISRIMNKFLG